MFYFFIIGCLTSWVAAQNGRGPQHLDHNGHGWDIRLAVPGEPGSDYPTLRIIPRTTFSCAGREPGYYADTETNCQVFRVCTVGSTYGFQSFLCPNGTLFNQAVFVCDWWMNVNCENSQQFVKKNYEQFENLRLGPQLMKDVKKMLTHPMRNPYDKGAMKSNFIVMQDYKPPAGQLFPNGALLSGPERAPNMIYVPKQNLIQNYINSDIAFSASTPAARYYTSSIFTTIKPTTYRNTEVFKQQGINGQNSRLQTENLSSRNLISNGHTRKFTQYTNTELKNNNGKMQTAKLTNQRTTPKNQRTTQVNNSDTVKTNSAGNNQRGQINRQNNKYTDFINSTPIKNASKKIQINTPKQNSNTDKVKKESPNQTTFTQAPYELAEEIQNEVKQNVVSRINNNLTPVFSTKTVAYSRIIENPQPGKPKSRITIKTWIVKPTKSAKIIASPSSYNFQRIIQPPTVINNTTPYFYDKPTTQSTPERIISKPNPTPYTYNRPTESAKQIDTTEATFTELDLPLTPTPIPSSTPISKQRSHPKFSGRLDVAPIEASTTQSPQIYLQQTTLKPSSRLYLPPQNMLSRQYLSPIIQPPVFYPINKLSDVTISPMPIFISNVEMQQPVATKVPEQSTSNLSFTDILTKDTLDRTVNSIVKDTKDILKTASPLEFDQYDQKTNSEVDAKIDSVTDSGESLTSESPTMPSKSARLLSFPSTNLEPPDESYGNPNFNQISNLPYFKESLLPPANTIERTVSLKITIPEKLAAYLFRNSNERDYDKLEILNTDNSNYLVLSNDLKTLDPNFIPLGKLIENNATTNISNSQALVFSLLADSINAAKEYSNIAQQEVLSSKSTPTQFQNINNEELSQITDKISQLTSAQFSGTNNRNANIVATPQTTSTTQGNQLSGNVQYMNNQQSTAQIPLQQLKNNFAPPQPQIQDNYNTMYQNLFRNSRLSENLFANNANQIYSGQLYQHTVPEVTDQIYNRPFLPDLAQPPSTPQNNIPAAQQSISKQNNIPLSLVPPNRNEPKFIQSSNMPQRRTQNTIIQSKENSVVNLISKEPSFEIAQSQNLPFESAKVQLEPSNEQNSLNRETITNLLNSDNGISAQLLDRIVGTIPHPLESNKLVTYEKDQSYYFTTKLNKVDPLVNSKINSYTQSNTIEQQNDKGLQNNNLPNKLTFQFIPSVGYELDNENEQQQLLSAFRIDEFGAPRDIDKSNLQGNSPAEAIMTTGAHFATGHPKSAKQIDDLSNVNTLYSGPSSYLAPQSSIGTLRKRQENVQNNFNSRLEDLNGSNENGYPKTRPTREFFF